MKQFISRCRRVLTLIIRSPMDCAGAAVVVLLIIMAVRGSQPLQPSQAAQPSVVPLETYLNLYPSYIPPTAAVDKVVLWWGGPCVEMPEFGQMIEVAGYTIYDGFISVVGSGECVLLTGPKT